MKESMNYTTKDEFTEKRREEIFNALSENERIAACSTLRAIRMKCTICAGNPDAAGRCSITSCPLWDFRFGTNPYKEVTPYTEEQLKEMQKLYDSLKDKL